MLFAVADTDDWRDKEVGEPILFVGAALDRRRTQLSNARAPVAGLPLVRLWRAAEAPGTEVGRNLGEALRSVSAVKLLELLQVGLHEQVAGVDDLAHNDAVRSGRVCEELDFIDCPSRLLHPLLQRVE